jgi:hypothetical protein
VTKLVLARAELTLMWKPAESRWPRVVLVVLAAAFVAVLVRSG